MKEFKVMLDGNIDTVKSFCHICEQFDFDLDIRSGKYTVDSKSILGVLSLKFSEPLSLSVNDDKYNTAVEGLKEFIVK